MQNKKSGFTIIEVVLVLAIAGLIFLMVFVALPSLQRSQRDTQRKNDLSTLSSAIVSYSSNNNKLPSDTGTFYTNITSGDSGKWSGFIYNYLLGAGNDEFAGPSMGYYTLNVTTVTTGNVTAPTALDTIAVGISASCNSNNDGLVHESRDGNRNFALLIRLEAGGTYCLDN